MPVLAITSVLLLTALAGHLFYRAWAPPRETAPWGEVLFAQFLVGVLVVGWPALLLAELGFFSLLCLALVLLAGCVVVLALRWPQVRRWRWPAARPDRGALLPLAIWLAAAVLLTWPGERILGGNDPGVYLGVGASIARTGGIVLHDPTIAALPVDRAGLFPLDAPYGQLVVLPGLYVTDLAGGEVTPQFLHLFPAWLAVFGAFGVPSLLAATPLFPLLGLACFYFAVGRTSGRWAAIVAMALLALNPALVWFAREPMAETLALALLMGGWYLFDRALAQPDRRDLGVWAALALGQVALCKIELLSLPFLLVLYLALRAAGRPLQPSERAFLLCYPLPLLHALVHLLTVSWPYLETSTTAFRSIGIMILTPGLVLALLIGAALAFAALLLLRRRLLGGIRRRLEAHAGRLRWGAAGGWLLLAVYAAAVRPRLSPAWVQVGTQLMPYNERLTFVRLSWYLAPLGLVLGVLGLGWWIVRRLNGPALPFLAAFGLEIVLYMHRTLDYAYHFWMMRRYLPLILPFLTLGIAAAVQFVRRAPLSRTVRRGGAALLLGLLIGYAVQVDAPWAARREMAGLVPALENLAAQVPDGAPVLVEHLGGGLATPLRLIWGRTAFALPEPVRWEELWDLLQRWPPGDSDSYLLLVNVPAVLHGGFVLSETASLSLDVLQTEQTIDELPRDAMLVRSLQVLLRVQRRAEAPAAVALSLVDPVWTGRCLALDLPPAAGPLLLRLEAAGFRPENVPPAQLQVSWNGQLLTTVPLERSWEMEEVSLMLAPPPGRMAGARDTHVELCVETWNPRAVGYGDDMRDLGILLRALEIAPSRSEAPAPPGRSPGFAAASGRPGTGMWCLCRPRGPHCADRAVSLPQPRQGALAPVCCIAQWQ